MLRRERGLDVFGDRAGVEGRADGALPGSLDLGQFVCAERAGAALGRILREEALLPGLGGALQLPRVGEVAGQRLAGFEGVPALLGPSLLGERCDRQSQ